MALIVIPIAIFMMFKGYKKHARKWVVITGSLGVVLIIIGAILPYVETNSAGKQAPSQSESGMSEQAAASG